MPGTKRDRALNLNAPVPHHEAFQPQSTPLPATARLATHFNYHDLAPPDPHHMAIHPSRPMSYLVPTVQPASAAPRPHPLTSHTLPGPLAAPTFSSPAPQPIPSPCTPDLDTIISRILSALKADRESAVETHRNDCDTRNKRAAAFFDKMFVAQQAHQKTIETKFTALDTRIASLEKSNIGRFDSLTYAVEDLLERVKGPAALSK